MFFDLIIFWVISISLRTIYISTHGAEGKLEMYDSAHSIILLPANLLVSSVYCYNLLSTELLPLQYSLWAPGPGRHTSRDLIGFFEFVHLFGSMNMDSWRLYMTCTLNLSDSLALVALRALRYLPSLQKPGMAVVNPHSHRNYTRLTIWLHAGAYTLNSFIYGS